MFAVDVDEGSCSGTQSRYLTSFADCLVRSARPSPKRPKYSFGRSSVHYQKAISFSFPRTNVLSLVAHIHRCPSASHRSHPTLASCNTLCPPSPDIVWCWLSTQKCHIDSLCPSRRESLHTSKE